MKPVNKLQLFSRSTKKVLYFVYFAAAGLIILFIIQYIPNSGDVSLSGSSVNPSLIPASSGNSGAIPAVNRSVKAFAVNSSAVSVVADSDYVIDPNAKTAANSVVALYKPSNNHRIIVRIMDTNPSASAEDYARNNAYLYGDDVESARGFTRSGFPAFRYNIVSRDQTSSYSVAYIKVQGKIHLLQVSAPVNSSVDESRRDTETELDALLSRYDLSSYENREFQEKGYAPN